MKDRITDALARAGSPMDLRALCDTLGADAAGLRPELDGLIAEGRVVTTRKGRFMTAEAAGLVAARIRFQRNGAPLAQPVVGGESMPVQYPGHERCMSDDLVLVRPDGARCTLHSILRRGRDSLPGYVRLEHGRSRSGRRTAAEMAASAVPCDPRLPYDIVLTGGLSLVQNDEIVLLKIESYPESGRPIYASVLRSLGVPAVCAR